jgi:hypothetical protein
MLDLEKIVKVVSTTNHLPNTYIEYLKSQAGLDFKFNDCAGIQQ